MSKKKFVKENLLNIPNIYYHRENLSLHQFVNELNVALAHYEEEGYKDLKVETLSDGEYESYEEYLQITGMRLETDKEYESRINKEAKQAKTVKARAKAKREKLLLQLKKVDKEIDNLS